MKVFQVNIYCLVALPFVQVKNGVWGVYHFPDDDALTTNPVQADAVSFVENKGGVDPKLGSDLTQIYESYIRISEDSSDPSIPHAKEYISVDISFTSAMDNEKAKKALRPALEVDDIRCFANMCSVRIPVKTLKNITDIASVKMLQPERATTLGGLVTSEGDAAMFADIVRSKYSVNGSSLLIGVLSDSYNCSGKAINDTVSGDLPSGNNSIVIVRDLQPCTGSDEGRAMMQLIHDVAPGARLAFRTAFGGQASFATGIVELADAGCDVIVDDVIYFLEPMFQDGIVAQAVNYVVKRGIPYFSSAGNGGANSWIAPFGLNPVNISNSTYHQFGTNSSGSPVTRMKITMQVDSRDRFFVFQWDEPFASNNGGPGSRSDIDVYLVLNGVRIAGGESYNIGRDPAEVFSFVPAAFSSNLSITVDFEIINYSGPLPSYMKLVVFGQVTSFEFPTNSSTGYGHMNAALAAGVGAAYFNNTPAFGVSPPLVEAFSSVGGTPILFTRNGTRLSIPEIRNQPRFSGPDGGATTFFGRLSKGVYRFFGTSASAPHVAAVAALMLEFKGGNRSLTPAEIYSTLSTTAIDMDDPVTDGFDVGFDFRTGWGLVNASAALDALALQTPVTAPIALTPVSVPVALPIAPTSVTSPVAPVTVPVALPIAPTSVVSPVAPIPVAVPVELPIAPTSVTYPSVSIPDAPTPVAAPVVPTSGAVTFPVPAPVPPTQSDEKCGLLGLGIFCPITYCGVIGRSLSFCRE